MAEPRLGQSAALLLLLIAGCFAIVPIPGLPIGIIFGSLGVAVALPLALGITRALPRRLAEQPLPPAVVRRVVRVGVPVLRRIERRMVPRWQSLVRGLGLRVAYASATLSAALVIMPVPFGNTLPGMAIITLALGLNRGDGAVTLVGHGLTALGLAWNVLLLTGGVALVLHIA